ncbi:MAG: T9SS type A sorting domain-containing protein [Bacteroidales bacterium]|nr:T9SS type A sorting domain-containing protein [Bacteroidales bacterium]
MKHLKLLLIVIAVSLAYTGTSQELSRHVFSAGGGNYESADMHVSWTIGQAEPVATSYQPTVIISAGFQQFDDQLVSVDEVSRENNFLVYPNPCSDFIRLDIQFEQSSSLSYRLYDFIGKMLINKKIPGQATSYQEVIDLSDLAPGIYNLMVITESSTTTSIKSIKLIRN